MNNLHILLLFSGFSTILSTFRDGPDFNTVHQFKCYNIADLTEVF